MEYVVVAFRVRSETIRATEIFRRYGIPCEIINTPKEANVGCGLSLKINKGDLKRAKSAIYSGGLKNVAGFFLVSYTYGRRSIRSI